MPDSNQDLERTGALETSDIFTKYWRTLATTKFIAIFLLCLNPLIAALLIPPLLLLRKFFGRKIFKNLNKGVPALSWLLYLYGNAMDTFEHDFRQAYYDKISSNVSGQVMAVHIFVGKDSVSVPILVKPDSVEANNIEPINVEPRNLDSRNIEANAFEPTDVTVGTDVDTLTSLLMWYNWMRYRRGFFELTLPRRLVRIDKVHVRVQSLV